jgi:signal transduction histidine kinase
MGRVSSPKPLAERQRILVVEDDRETAASLRLYLEHAGFEVSRARETGGAGLGMAIVLQLAQVQGDSIAVESEPGRGTRFTVVLPSAPSPGGRGSE